MYEGKLQESHFLPVLLTVFGASGSAADGNSGGVCTGAGVKTPGQSEYYQCENDWKQQGTINWKKASNATKYRIYYKQSGARSWKAITDVSSGKTSYTHTSNSRNPLAGGKNMYTR